MSRFSRSMTRAAAAVTMALSFVGATQAETFGDWEATQFSSVYVAQTRGETIALYIICSPSLPGMVANLVTGSVVPAFGELPGPVASFAFSEADRFEVGALPNLATENPERILTVAMYGERMDSFIGSLRRESQVDVAVAGGATNDALEQVSTVLSLQGSGKALDFIARSCNQV